MALWGKNDNLASAGNVTLNYSTLEVTNSGSNFAASDVGKVIRFGTRGSGGTYFGDAVIVKYTSATKVSIGHTFGLKGGAISAVPYYKSELPYIVTKDKKILYDKKQDVRNLSLLNDIYEFKDYINIDIITLCDIEIEKYKNKFIKDKSGLRQASSFLVQILVKNMNDKNNKHFSS